MLRCRSVRYFVFRNQILSRRLTDKSEASRSPLGIFSSLPESVRWALGIGASGFVVAMLPILPETKRGFREALNPNRRDATISPVWGWIFGGFGFMGAYGGTTSYLTRIGQANPVLAGFKTPFALFGAILGGKLCNDLAPLLFDASGIISRLTSYTADGFIADTVGRPPNQPAAWEILLGNIFSDHRDGYNNTSSDTSPGKGPVGSAESPSSAESSASKCERLLTDSILRLVALRRREDSLRTSLSLASWWGDRSMMQKSQEPEMRAIAREKHELKATVLSECGLRLARHLDKEIRRAGDDLTRMRLEQVALATEMGAARGAGEPAGRREALARELRRLDAEKARLKRAARRELGVNLARVARKAPSWRSAASEARDAGRR
jgi:hypothetical protein